MPDLSELSNRQRPPAIPRRRAAIGVVPDAGAGWRISDEFSVRERVAIEFADRYVSDHLSLDTNEELWERLHAAFSDEELVDLALFAGASMIGGRFLHVFGLYSAACALPVAR